MRVTNATFYHDYAKSVQDLHSDLNNSIKQAETGRKYDTASENPLAYYGGKTIDHQYSDADAKDSVISDVSNRLSQQEQGARDIQTTMRTINTNLLRLRSEPSSGEVTTIETLNNDFRQRLQSMANTLNSQYENFYVFGGNDTTTVPFSLQEDLNDTDPSKSSYTLTFSHHFPGERNITTVMAMKFSLNDSGEISIDYSGKKVTADDYGNVKGSETLTSDEVQSKILAAMTEQGRMSLGYGDLANRDTLPDTFTGGLNLITGLGSDSLKNVSDSDGDGAPDASGQAAAISQIDSELKRSPVGLTIKTILSTQRYTSAANNDSADSSAVKEQLLKNVGDVIDEWDDSEQRVSNTYRELGLREEILTSTKTNLKSYKDTLQEQYDDKVGIDQVEAITKMYSMQYSYTAALRLGSNVMQSSLFDYVR